MKILVTGGSGTIGRMICKKLKDQGHYPISLIRNPANQLCSEIPFQVGRVEEYHDVLHIIQKYEIEGIIHAAANKHVSVCERQPSEAVSVNVLGSLNILKSIEEFKGQIKRAIFISSDKACNGQQVYGISKALMEKLVKEYSDHVKAKINCVRFGNVFGSSGSVVPIWNSKVGRGQDIELRMFFGQAPIRFGILPSEAADFCLDVFNYNSFENGSVILREMNVINIKTLAEAMVENSLSKIIIQEAGLGEAQQELLFTEEERKCLCRHENNHVEISQFPQSAPIRFSNEANKRDQLNYEQTKAFLHNVLKELKNGSD